MGVISSNNGALASAHIFFLRCTRSRSASCSERRVLGLQDETEASLIEMIGRGRLGLEKALDGLSERGVLLVLVFKHFSVVLSIQHRSGGVDVYRM